MWLMGEKKERAETLVLKSWGEIQRRQRLRN